MSRLRVDYNKIQIDEPVVFTDLTNGEFYTSRIRQNGSGFYLNFTGSPNNALLKIFGINKYDLLRNLGLPHISKGDWPYTKSLKDLTILIKGFVAEVNRIYSKETKTETTEGLKLRLKKKTVKLKFKL